jgi:hypothetical protein
VGPRAVLGAVVKRKIPSPRRESNGRDEKCVLNFGRKIEEIQCSWEDDIEMDPKQSVCEVWSKLNFPRTGFNANFL